MLVYSEKVLDKGCRLSKKVFISAMNLIIENFRKTWQGIVMDFRLDIASLRSGRISSAIIEDIEVESYGSKLTLKELASFSLLSPNVLIINPWDKSLIPSIEKAIQDSEIGVTPSNDGNTVQLVFPPLTEEKRQTLVKILKQKLEEYRIKFRQHRDGVRKQIQELFEEKKINEDEKYQLNEQLQKEVDEFNRAIDEIAEAKEKEILTL